MNAIKDGLIAQGHTLLLDETNDDATLASMMVKMIKECDHAICIISPEYKKSENCQREFDFINIKKKDFTLVAHNYNIIEDDEIMLYNRTRKYYSHPEFVAKLKK